MAEVKKTKTELRQQQQKKEQLEKYLPTLQLKKAMLQAEVAKARVELQEFKLQKEAHDAAVQKFSPLLKEQLSINIETAAIVLNVQKDWVHIAGVIIPRLQSMTFAPFHYDLFDTPPWVDLAAIHLRKQREAIYRFDIAQEKVVILQKALREVAIRVNLFEKILIPRSLKNIKNIKIFLGDQQLAAVSQAKEAYKKIQVNAQSRCNFQGYKAENL